MPAGAQSRFRPALLMALTGFCCGLIPLLLVHFSLGLFTRLFTLLFAVYAAFFFSLALLPLGAALPGRLFKARRPLPWLRAFLLLEAAALSALWYRLLNPFPAGPLIQNQQYLPALLVVLVLLAGWSIFLFILKKIL